MPVVEAQADPVLLITGASRGIGAATARAAAAKYRLVLAARRPVAPEVLERLGGPGRAVTVACDVTEWDDVQRACAIAVDRFGRLDAAFANAGVSTDGSFTGPVDPAAWKEMKTLPWPCCSRCRRRPRWTSERSSSVRPARTRIDSNAPGDPPSPYPLNRQHKLAGARVVARRDGRRCT